MSTVITIAMYLWFLGAVATLWVVTWYVRDRYSMKYIVPIFLLVCSMSVIGSFVFYEYWTGAIWVVVRYSWSALLMIFIPVIFGIRSRI